MSPAAICKREGIRILMFTVAKWIGTSVLVGILTTLMLAWIATACQPLPPELHQGAAMEWPSSVPESWPDRPLFEFRRIGRIVEWHYCHAMRYGDTEPMRLQCWEFSAGWPFRALSATLIGEVPRDSDPQGVVDQSGRSLRTGIGVVTIGSGPSTDKRPVPIRPIWLGLVANTVLTGAAFFLMFGLSIYFVRNRRRRNMKCWRCGYVQVSPNTRCSECGAISGSSLTRSRTIAANESKSLRMSIGSRQR